MNKQEHRDLIDLILNARTSLLRLLLKTKRGAHRQQLAVADDALCEILRDLQNEPQGMRLARREH